MVMPGVGSMDANEELNFIKDHKAGVLSLVDGDRPYSLPLEHYFDGKSLYFIISSRENQRKINCIKNNPHACFVIYDSRRDQSEIRSNGLVCRSVIMEGKISLHIKEMDRADRKVKVQMLKLDVEKIGNWMCPSQSCDWQTPWFIKHPELAGTD